MCVCVDAGGGGGRVSGRSLENHSWLNISLEILVRTPLENQLDPWGFSREVRTAICKIH